VSTDCGKGGHYFFTVKDNQPILKQDIMTIWEAEPPSPPQVTRSNKRGGRVEQRRLWVSDILVGYSDWPYLAQVCRLERTVARKGETSRELAYAVTSLSPQEANPRQLLTLWRGHWGIENRVHWVRHVTLDEDRCQIRTGAAPQVMAALRNMTISLLRLAGKPNIAAALRRHAAHPSEALTLVGASR
jgi:predicted transposase YbfD/YdcC